VELATKYTVYRLYDAADTLLYVGCTKELGARLAAHAYDKVWWPEVVRVEEACFEDPVTAADAEEHCARAYAPRHNGGKHQRYRISYANIDGERLQELRKGANLSREALARRAHLSHRTVFRIEKGQTKQVHELTLMALADALGVETHELLER
jgi:DNA-binding XRE family transcriptional regulator